MNSLYFESTGLYIPPKVVSNDDLSQIVQTSDEWIFPRTGIHNRHINEELTNAQMAAKAGQSAMERGGINPDDLCCVIMATFSPDTFSPANACAVHDIMGLPEHVLAFDVNAACPAFLVSLHIARGLLMQHPNKKALVIASEFASDYTDWTDRGTCVLFGDGAGAAVVSLREDGEIYFTGGTRKGIEAIQVSANPKSGDDFRVIRMNGKDVFRFAVTAVPDAIENLLGQSGLALEDIDHFIFHQANMRIIKHVYQKMGIPKEKCYTNIEEYGNTSAASSAIATAEMDAKGILKRGDKVIMVCFGAGLVYEGILLEW